MRPRFDPVLLLLLVLAAGYVFWDAGRGFQLVDEFWYGEIVRAMLESGDLITPRFAGQPEFIKPPVYYWLSLPAATVLPLEAALRVVPGLCLLALLLGLHSAVRGLFGLGAARLSAAALLLSYDPLHVHGFRAGVFDALVALEVGAVFLCCVHLERRPGLLRVIAALVGLTFLTKTAFAVFPLALTGLTLWLLRGRLQLTGALWLQSIACGLAVVVPWFAAAIALHGSAVLETMLLDQVVKRAINDTQAAQRGGRTFGRGESLFVIRHALAYGQPWWLLGLTGLAGTWRDRGSALSQRTLCLRLAAAWIVAVFAAFLISRAAWPWYVGSAYVPLALVVGVVLDGYVRAEAEPLVPPEWVEAAVAAALFVAPAIYAHDPYRVLPALLRADPSVLTHGLIAALWILAFRRATSAGRDLRLGLAGPLALGYAAVVWALWAEDWGLSLTVCLVGVGVPAAVLGASVLVGMRASGLRRAGVVLSVVVLAAGFQVAPLRFAGQAPVRPEVRWVQAHERDGRLREPLERVAPVYDYVVVYQVYRERYEVSYEPQTRTLRVAPKR